MHTLISRTKAGLAVFFVTLLIAPHAHAARGLPGKYHPVKIASGIKMKGHGSVAWSPDGTRIAYIRKKVEVHDTRTGGKSSLKLRDAYYVIWASEKELLVLHRDGGNPVLGQVDAETLEVKTLPLPMGADAVYPLGDGRLLLASSGAERISIGLEVSYGLSVYREGEIREVYHTSRILPRRTRMGDYLRGWLSAGPNPVGDEMVLLELVDPPALEPYLKICLIDYMTGRKKEIARMHQGRFRISGSWSPMGRRVALVDEEGHLRILVLDGALHQVDDSVTGENPSWNPRGGEIFFGGYLLRADRQGREEILEDGAESMAFWSPDGTKMAFIDDGKLWILGGFTPVLSPTDRLPDKELLNKVRILRQLLSEKLLTEDEYHARYERLLRKYWEAE